MTKIARTAPTAAAAPSGPSSVEQTVNQLKAEGYTVIVNKVGAAPADQCTVAAVRAGQTYGRSDSGTPGAQDDIHTPPSPARPCSSTSPAERPRPPGGLLSDPPGGLVGSARRLSGCRAERQITASPGFAGSEQRGPHRSSQSFADARPPTEDATP